jgi:hypothetical protein
MYECRIDFPNENGVRRFGTGRIEYMEGNGFRSPNKFDTFIIINSETNKPVAFVDLRAIRKFLSVVDAVEAAERNAQVPHSVLSANGDDLK